MSWPTNPQNGDTTTINGVVYAYNSAINAWGPANVTGASAINYSGNVTAQNLVVVGNVYINNDRVSTEMQSMMYALAF